MARRRRRSRGGSITDSIGCAVVLLVVGSALTLAEYLFYLLVDIYTGIETTYGQFGAIAAVGLLLVPCVLIIITILIVKRTRRQAYLERMAGLDPTDLDKLSPEEFERWIVLILTHAGLRATRIGGSGDYGADVIAGNRYRIAIQAKRYAGTVGNKAVAEVRQAMDVHDCIAGIVATQSVFSRNARIAAKKSTRPIHLSDRTSIHLLPDVVRMLQNEHRRSRRHARKL